MVQAEERKTETAIFAGGCFWCMESAFQELDGVLRVTSGFTGGDTDNPSYSQVSSGSTTHAEAVEIEFDPTKISYKKLLDIYWKNTDPTVTNRQFCDVGSQYRPEIFYLSDEQKKLAEDSKAEIIRTKKFEEDVLTPITKASAFYPAEEYHQDFYKKNPIRYKSYRFGCGRDQRLRQLWE